MPHVNTLNNLILYFTVRDPQGSYWVQRPNPRHTHHDQQWTLNSMNFLSCQSRPQIQTAVAILMALSVHNPTPKLHKGYWVCCGWLNLWRKHTESSFDKLSGGGRFKTEYPLFMSWWKVDLNYNMQVLATLLSHCSYFTKVGKVGKR